MLVLFITLLTPSHIFVTSLWVRVTHSSLDKISNTTHSVLQWSEQLLGQIQPLFRCSLLPLWRPRTARTASCSFCQPWPLMPPQAEQCLLLSHWSTQWALQTFLLLSQLCLLLPWKMLINKFMVQCTTFKLVTFLTSTNCMLHMLYREYIAIFMHFPWKF